MTARLRADARTLPVLALLACAFGLAARADPTLAQAGTYAGIDAIAAIGLSVLLGNVNQISIGQAGFFGIGAYAVGFLTTAAGWPFWIAAPAGTAAAALAGLLLGFIALRFRGHYLAMATLAFGLIVTGVFHESAAFGGPNGIQDIPFARAGPFVLSGLNAFVGVWVAAFGVAFLTINLLRGRTGRAFEAIRNDELAAEAIGVPTRAMKIAAFTYAGALAGLAGALYAAFLGLIVPDAVGVPLSIDLLLMVVLGGQGSVSGAIAGAALIGVLDISGHAYENWREVGYGALVIAVVVAAPGGLFGLVWRRVAPATAPQPPQPPTHARPKRIGAPSGAPPLEVRDLIKRFGGLVAVDRVSFTLQPGTLTALIGPNGAGKTTLFNAICGIGRPTSGSVRIAGVDAGTRRPHRIAALGVGRTFQNARLFSEMTVLENVVAGALRLERGTFADDLFGLPAARASERAAGARARAALARLGLEAFADAPAGTLPFGVRRRVELARALAAEPWLLLVDEPAAGLNAHERETLRDDLLALRDAGMTLLLIEHDMRLVMSMSDRVLVLAFGRTIADGPPAAVRDDPAVVAAYLGTAG